MIPAPLSVAEKDTWNWTAIYPPDERPDTLVSLAVTLYFSDDQWRNTKYHDKSRYYLSYYTAIVGLVLQIAAAAAELTEFGSIVDVRIHWIATAHQQSEQSPVPGHAVATHHAWDAA